MGVSIFSPSNALRMLREVSFAIFSTVLVVAAPMCGKITITKQN